MSTHRTWKFYARWSVRRFATNIAPWKKQLKPTFGIRPNRYFGWHIWYLDWCVRYSGWCICACNQHSISGSVFTFYGYTLLKTVPLIAPLFDFACQSAPTSLDVLVNLCIFVCVHCVWSIFFIYDSFNGFSSFLCLFVS